MADSVPPSRTSRATSPPSALSLPSLLPSAAHHPPPKRADLISLKQRLAQLLAPHPELGELYWTGLTEFVLGKITRSELGEILERCFNKSSDRIQAINLHNALLLSILYNTTRPTLPSSSIRHTGFNPRGTKKRNLLSILGQGGYEGDAEEPTELQEKRTKKIKQVVMMVGKRERAEIKANANTIVKKEDTVTGEAGGESVGKALRASKGGQGEVAEGGIPKGYKDVLEQKGSTIPTNFTQEYNRLVQAPLCCESRSLPDAETLRDRMMLIAYEEGMIDGVDGSGVANLLSNAMDYYVKQIISSAVSLVRGPSHSPNPLPSSSKSASTSTFAPAGASTPNVKQALSPLPEVHSPGTPPSSSSVNEPRARKRPLAISDFHALFAVQPGLLGTNGSTHTSAVERMYALPPQSDSEDDPVEEEDEDRTEGRKTDVPTKDSTGDTNMSLDDPPPNSAPTPVSGKMPRLSTASRNRALSFYGAARPVPPVPSNTSSSPHGTPGRTKFLLDPTSLHGVPEGHPDVPHVSSTSVLPPLVVPTSSNVTNDSSNVPNQLTTTTNGVPANAAPGASNSQALSPKSLSLRNSLFPELANPPAASSNAASGSGSGGGAGSSGSKLASQGGEDGHGKNGNGTTTDEADSEFDDLTEKIAGELNGKKGSLKNSTAGGGLKIKLGGQTTGTVTPTPTSSNMPTPGGVGGNGPNVAPKSVGEKDKEMGRKLWEVVDSVRLLDGVLDP
ncbi:hypothetical protein JCM5350_003491 [Sporobolomyces pararoseus]